MKRFAYFLHFTVIASTLISCTLVNQILGGAAEWIKPGDKLGEMTVEQGSRHLPYPHIYKFCKEMPDQHEPVTFKSECDVPLISGLALDIGWLAKESKIESNWEAMVWDLYIDDHKIDLEAFDWHEFDFIAHGEDNKARHWLIDLRNLSPGNHTFRYSLTSEITIDDGFNVYQPGTYEYIANFTVLEKAAYPNFSSTVNIGQHPYTSKKAHRDFLLYLPGDYEKDPQHEWPLIVYLHGADLRGTTLDLLMEEPLLRKLEKETNFPFIVVSPLGDGAYDFWAEHEMISSVFTLLEEIQTEVSVDPKRIYLTGNDMGGNGVWAIGLSQPAYFAALAPISGYYSYPFEVPENICDLKDVPIWAFHGRRDPFVPVDVEQELVDALNACGGNAQISVSHDMKNDVQHKVYSDPELYEWFASQTLK